MVDLNGHEAGNGGYSQGRPTARRALLYSERCPVSRAVHPAYQALARVASTIFPIFNQSSKV